MIVHFILNPMSGKSSTLKNVEEALKRSCIKRCMSYHIYYTTREGDATDYVRQMIRATTERQRFICIGGDGTMNEIVNSAPCNPNVEFGVIPNGSGNDFVRNFTNTHLFSNIEAQLDGETVPLDLIKVNNDYCVNMINIGFDGESCREAARFRKFKFISPSMRYILGVVIVLCTRYGSKMKLMFDDGEVVDDELLLTSIGNGSYCGGGFRSAPIADLQDGLLDLAIIKRVSRLKFLSMVGVYKKGAFIDNKRVRKVLDYKQVNHFKMKFPDMMYYSIDGEIRSAKNIDFTVVKNGFNFVMPRGCEFRYATKSKKKK